MSKGQTLLRADSPDVPRLHMCPYCSQGYRRNASLMEHIRFRHETSDDDSYSFTHRSHPQRHMSRHHHGNKEQVHPQAKPQRRSRASRGSMYSSMGRRFKCNTCFKAFKLKHHLKEHLRIHSGEKPYECVNCKKRFAHSGSYSAHISSFKCAAAYFPNGLRYAPLKPRQAALVSARLAIARKHGKTVGKPLQQQIPLTQIKTEPTEGDTKPIIVPPVNRSQGVARVLETRAKRKQGFVVERPQQEILRLPAFIDHDGTTKVLINYSLNPASSTRVNTRPNAPVGSAGPIIAAVPILSGTEQSCLSEMQDVPTDMSISKVVKEKQGSVPNLNDLGIVISKTESVAEMPKGNRCLLCEECPEHLEAVHLLQHRKAANGEAVDSAALDPSFADLLSEAGVMLHEPSPTEDILLLLKTMFASNPNPSHTELEKISETVGIPTEVIWRWFAKRNREADGEKSEPVEEIPTDEDTAMQDTAYEETQDLEWQENPELPINLISRKCKNNKIRIVKTSFQKESQLENKSKTQEKSDLLEKLHSCSKSSENLELQEIPGSQSTSMCLPGSNKDLKVVAETEWNLTNLANLELHNYSKSSENLERQEIPESQSALSSPDLDKDLKAVVQTKLNLANLKLHNYSKPSENLDLQSTSVSSHGSDKDFYARDSQAEPLDLSQLKSPPSETTESLEEITETQVRTTSPGNAAVQLNHPEPRALYVTTPHENGSWSFVTATQIPTLVACAGHGAVGCLTAFNPSTKQRTFLIPQLSYTYTPGARSEKRAVTASRSPR